MSGAKLQIYRHFPSKKQRFTGAEVNMAIVTHLAVSQ